MADKNFFPEIGEVVENEEHLPTVIQSLCMNCHEQGETRLLLTSIPFFRDVILSSFYCPHCYYKTVDVQPGLAAQVKGCVYRLKIKSRKDLQRQIVKSEHAVVRFLELDFEIPPKVGKLTTVEGLLSTAIDDLKEMMKQKNSLSEDVYAKLTEYLPKLTLASIGQVIPLTMVISDPAGNSFVQNYLAPKADPDLKIEYYIRSKSEDEALGIMHEKNEKIGSNIEEETDRNDRVTVDKLDQEHMKIPAECPNCGYPGFSEMCVTNVPFFKEIIIFAFSCESCGIRNNEVKGGGAISEKGKRLILKITKDTFQEDMRRDVVKSTSAGVLIPEIELEVTTGSLGGLYTTVEGLLKLIYGKLFESSLGMDTQQGLGNSFAFSKGDSAEKGEKSKLDLFQEKFDNVLAGNTDFTLVVDDPLDNSFIYSPTAPEPEEALTIELYERTHEQNDEFGLNDMNTDSYLAEHQHSKEVLDKMKGLQVKGESAHPNEAVIGMPDEYQYETVS